MLPEMFISAFITLFVVIDPPGCAPIYAGLTKDASAAQARNMALRATTIAAVILTIFAFFGEALQPTSATQQNGSLVGCTAAQQEKLGDQNEKPERWKNYYFIYYRLHSPINHSPRLSLHFNIPGTSGISTATTVEGGK